MPQLDFIEFYEFLHTLSASYVFLYVVIFIVLHVELVLFVLREDPALKAVLPVGSDGRSGFLHFCGSVMFLVAYFIALLFLLLIGLLAKQARLEWDVLVSQCPHFPPTGDTLFLLGAPTL